MDGAKERITPKKFLFNILNGVALAIVVGLIPNAILGGLFGYLAQYGDIFTTLQNVVVGIQFTIPVLTGVLIAMQFGMTPLQTVVVGTAAFVGSGAAEFTDSGWIITGIGDLINTMITSAIADGIMLIIKDKLGSLSIILLPIIGGGIAGLAGILLLPYVNTITLGLGLLINSITTTQPIIMSILISVLFSIVIISPVSTVAIAYAIGISGVAAGSAAIGVASAAIMLFIGTYKVNKIGVPIAVILGAMKMMMPNMIRYPILLLPVSLTAAVSGLVSGLLNIQGTPASAGFGLVGFVGPIQSMALLDGGIGSVIFKVIVAYVIVPLISALLFHYLFVKILKIYKPTIFYFEAES